ncbi:permease-like cell division protein FtsX [Floricoccus penangensis]|uniref:permease-like cell division protein FtsX n=1 Tax=Floricoccus penangensis TaxID=1859475 RepID=UPI0020415AAA|nr:permease-like cell division protein FtsX [Floricoccus penangensis]URZ88498.1 permease-like cell division protein FtsX [Floricoccus penangensis]
MIRNFFRHILDSFKNLRRNGWMTIAAVSSVTITLALLGIFLSVILNTAKLATDIENNVRIMTYTKLDRHDNDKQYTDPKDKTKVIDNKDYHVIYDQIEKLDHVTNVTFSSKDDQLKKLTDNLGDTWELFKGDANPLYDVYVVEADKPENVKPLAKKLSEIDGVQKAEYGGKNTDRIFKVANTIKTWGLAGSALLIFVAIFLISNTIRITIMSRSREIQIMSLVGAKKGYIRWPFFLEGAWVGLIGSIIPVLLVNYLYNVAYKSFTPSLITQGLSIIKPTEFLPVISILIVAIGMVIGSLGSVISMRRYLKI